MANDGECRNFHRSARALPATLRHARRFTLCYDITGHSLTSRLCRVPAQEAEPSGGKQGLEEILGLTPREAEVLSLVARGYTDREIAATLVISVKTASVHVSHILRKLGAPNRLEAAAIMHRLSPPQARQPESDA